MAGTGPAPKPAGQRRRRNAPARGEWIDLPPLDSPILPELPERSEAEGEWSERTIFTWKAWQQDPATTQYGPAAKAQALNLAYLFEGWVRGDEKWSEVRLTMDGLGLTEKGKRDLRWRVQPGDEDPETDKVKSSKSVRNRVRATETKD